MFFAGNYFFKSTSLKTFALVCAIYTTHIQVLFKQVAYV